MSSKIIAHRGYSGKYPENTMLAFKQAQAHQADGIELDIHLTKDQQIVICHDEKVDRTSNGTGYIKDLTLEEIQTYKFLNHMDQYSDEKLSDITAPSLDEFFDWFTSNEMEVNIEIKNNIFEYPGIIESVLDLIEKYQLHDRVIISSFNHRTVLAMKEMEPRLKYGFLTACSLLEPGKYCWSYSVDYYHPFYMSLTDDDILLSKELRIGLNVWTVNDEEGIRAMNEKGIDRIITNYVELAKKVIL